MALSLRLGHCVFKPKARLVVLGLGLDVDGFRTLGLGVGLGLRLGLGLVINSKSQGVKPDD